MSKDKRLFARLDLDYADHPKIMMLSDAAFRAHITFLLYSRKYMTDGVINNRVANRVASQWDSDVLTELTTNDEANPSLVKLESGDFYLHGFEDMQETRAEIELRTARNQANGRKGGRPKKPKETQSVTESGTPVGKPNVTQIKAETETETETETDPIPSNEVIGGQRDESPPKPFCKNHPTGTEKPCTACKIARQTFDESEKRAEIVSLRPPALDDVFCKTHYGYPPVGCERCLEAS